MTLLVQMRNSPASVSTNFFSQLRLSLTFHTELLNKMAALRKAFADAFIKTAKADKALAGASITARFSDRVHNIFVETLTKELQTTGKVSIPGFGAWTVVYV
jgi:nucleoid DNA-binding protein